MRICVPIVAQTVEAALAKMERAFPVADLLELRIDRCRDMNLPRLLREERERIVVTNRSAEEGGGGCAADPERVRLLIEAARLGAGYVDVEAATDSRLIGELKNAIRKSGGQTRLIVSNHDLRETPGGRALRTRFEACRAAGADIVKIATTARSMEDNLKILGLIPFAGKQGVPLIALCMGEAGRVSRVMAPLLGSYLAFASLDRGEESAPGQLTVKEMREILERVQGAKGSRVRVKQSEKDI